MDEGMAGGKEAATGGVFRRVGENLVQRRGSGTIYLRAKIAGRKGPVRISLETSDLRVAKIARDARLELLRAAASGAAESGQDGVRTLGDALARVAAREVGKSHQKASSSKYNGEICGVLRETLPVDLLPKRWDEREARLWWKLISQRFGHTRANALLHMVRKVARVCVEEGLLRSDPTAGLVLVKGTKKLRVLPSRADLQRVIAEVSVPRKRTSAEAGLMVAFLAATGVRPEEARGMVWANVLPQWLRITGGETGTKNREERLLPISGPLQEILTQLRALGNKGKVFSIQDPRASLRNACVRLELPHLTLYDMRHYFITWAIESGVDIPTVAKWIGHRDGGALLIRTYTHIRDLHSLEKAQLLK